MWIFFSGLLLWLAVLAAAARVAVIGFSGRADPRWKKNLWLVLVLAAAAMLFRPHEDIFGGQDQGAYVNSAGAYARADHLFYRDPLLAGVPEEARRDFLYGHRGYPDTKYMCLWVPDVARATVGPWFQPAFSVLLAAVARIAPAPWVLYVPPLFVLLSGLALWALARKLIDYPWAGEAAFLLYGFNPLVAWHGRCARAELVASFLVLSGALLLVHAWRDPSGRRWPDAALGALCMALAPFFHITAWMVVIPAGCMVAVLILAGRPDFAAYPFIAVSGVLTFVLQTRRITDCYRIGPTLDRLFPSPAAGLLPIIAAGVLVAVGLTVQPRFSRRRIPLTVRRLGLAFSVLVALGTAAVLLGIVMDPDVAGRILVRRSGVFQQIRLTDVPGFVRLVSRPMALLGLTGWLVLFLAPGAARPERNALALVLLPGFLCAGHMPHFMYYSRRVLAFGVPLYVLSLAALPLLVPSRPGAGRSWLCAGLSAGMVLLGARNRLQLYTVTEYRGFTSFLRSFADVVRSRNGILLCEYSRIAAPFDHLFGIPTLGLDNEHQDNYARAEAAWEGLMRAQPDRPAFFMTPFQAPASDRFEFSLVRSRTHTNRFLASATGRVPEAVQERTVTLRLYRMHLAAHRRSPSEPRTPREVPLGAGNMGFRRFANLRDRTWELAGLPFAAGESRTVELPDGIHPAAKVFLFFLEEADGNPPPTVEVPEHAADSWLAPADGWGLRMIAFDGSRPSGALTVASPAERLLTDVVVLSPGGVTERVPVPEAAVRRHAFRSRWARAEAGVFLPFDADGTGCSLWFLAAARGHTGQSVSLTLGEPGVTCRIGPGWQWLVVPERRLAAGPGPAWVALRTVPPWDPQMLRYPNDLGVLVGRIVLLPQDHIR